MSDATPGYGAALTPQVLAHIQRRSIVYECYGNRLVIAGNPPSINLP
jgi:hypothetical protein